MEPSERREHWESIYRSKSLEELSWFQPTPVTSLAFLKQFHIPVTSKIIDIGGGDSLLVDHLLDLGYSDITVLDISATALDRAKQRLGPRAALVKWIVADAAHYQPTEKYNVWHDRAAFHFLTDEKEIANYIATASLHIEPDGFLVIGTFSEEGPDTCSGIKIKQYSEQAMSEKLGRFFHKLKCIPTVHKTPFGTFQHFVFCGFRKLQPYKP